MNSELNEYFILERFMDWVASNISGISDEDGRVLVLRDLTWDDAVKVYLEEKGSENV